MRGFGVLAVVEEGREADVSSGLVANDTVNVTQLGELLLGLRGIEVYLYLGVEQQLIMRQLERAEFHVAFGGDEQCFPFVLN